TALALDLVFARWAAAVAGGGVFVMAPPQDRSHREPGTGEARQEAEAQALGALCRRAAGGDQAAFRAWVNLVTPTLYRLGLRMVGSTAEAEDVVQETVVRAWQGLAGLRDPDASLGWACGIARHIALDHLRRRARRPTVELDAQAQEGARPVLERLADPGASPEEQVSSGHAQQVLRAVIATLPEKHRLVLMFRDIDGMSIEETAAALGCPPGTVDSRLHRARALLGKKVRALSARRGWRFWQ
ncbi:MAG: sigma-70 family RNA polymerase sigma factor, partial [Myxococcota bacterium]